MGLGKWGLINALSTCSKRRAMGREHGTTVRFPSPHGLRWGEGEWHGGDVGRRTAASPTQPGATLQWQAPCTRVASPALQVHTKTGSRPKVAKSDLWTSPALLICIRTAHIHLRPRTCSLSQHPWCPWALAFAGQTTSGPHPACARPHFPTTPSQRSLHPPQAEARQAHRTQPPALPMPLNPARQPAQTPAASPGGCHTCGRSQPRAGPR